MYELSTLLTVIVRTVAGWFGVHGKSPDLPLLYSGLEGASETPRALRTSLGLDEPGDVEVALPLPASCGPYANWVDAVANGGMGHCVTGDSGGSGLYI